jgi:hypothetical protein
MFRLTALLLACLTLSACGRGSAPADDGVCWLAQPAKAGAPIRYDALQRQVGSLEDCAVLLEASRLQGRAIANGAYQGFYIYVDANRMTAGTRPDGLLYPVLQPPQRAAIDRDLQKLIAEHGGKIPPDISISLQRQPGI